MKTKLFLLVLALQSAWILGTAVTQERVLRLGQVIRLETQPVDPRDFLRGDFLRLNYKISDVPRERFSPPLHQDPAAGAKIYVALAPAGTNDCWEITRASLEFFAPAAGEVLLCGNQVRSLQLQTGSLQTGGIRTVDCLRVEYGLEQFFVAEGTGHPSGKLTALVAVSKSGRASLKEVFVDGKPYAEAMKSQRQ